MPQDQEEFYFSVPYDVLDMCLYGRNHDLPADEVARLLSLETEQVERIYKDIEAKRRTTRYQHMPPLLVEPIDEIRTCEARTTEGEPSGEALLMPE
jgi:NAD+ synthase